MLKDEHKVFPEEVGGARAQPHPSASNVTHNTHAAAAAAVGTGVSSLFSSSSAQAAVYSSQRSVGRPQDMENNRERGAFAPAVNEDGALGDDGISPNLQQGDMTFNVLTSTYVNRGDNVHGTEPVAEFTNNINRSSPPQQRKQRSPQRQLEGVRKRSSLSSSLARKEAAFDEELFEKDDGVVLTAHPAPASSLSSSSFTRGGSNLRGPPNASVMGAAHPTAPTPSAAAEAVVAAPTTTLMATLASFHSRTHEDEDVFLSQGLPRPTSQNSISFSIRSTSSSRSSKAGEVMEDRESSQVITSGRPAYRVNAVACEDANNKKNGGGGSPPTLVNGGETEVVGTVSRRASAPASAHGSPVTVSLWGVHRDLRRKRIKKVSHYILGSLLGEGTYGVVRDCIDINTDNINRRFQRCAIKIVNGAYAKADMPAIFGSRTNKNHEEENGSGSPSGETAPNTMSSPMRRTLNRASEGGNSGGGGGAVRYHREEEQKRQEMFQREMRNLQRFHCKNIIRATDSFTRYNKEYVVLPIAICSVQQLVEQWMRTHWREAVRAWRRRQRNALQKQQRAAAAATTIEGEGEEAQHGQNDQCGLPLVPSAVDTLDLDDLTFMMMADGSGGDDDDTENGFDEDEDEDVGTTTSSTSEDAHRKGQTAATHTKSSNKTINNSNSGNSSTRHGGVPRNEAENGDEAEDGRHSSASLSDHEDDAYHRHNKNVATRRGEQINTVLHANSSNANNCNSSRRRGLPRVSSTGSNTTTTTTTTRTIDSYDNGINNNNNSNNAHGVSRRRRCGGEDETSDASSCGVNSSSNANSNCIRVMSATPTMQDGEFLLGGGGEGTKKLNDENPCGVGVARHSMKVSKEGTAASSKGATVDDSRPHLTYPLCSTTLLKGIFYQVISGVNYLHQQNLAHNDIKPSNVLLFEDGSVKLGDLGSVSEEYNDQGTPLYASPELCKYFYGAVTPPASFSQSQEAVGRNAAKPSDMWCCGLLLYYLITGKPGPLPVQLRYFQSLHSKREHHNRNGGQMNAMGGGAPQLRGTEREKAAAAGDPPPIITRYQLYREIASQTAPVDLSGLPDMIPPDLGDDAVVVAAGGLITEKEEGKTSLTSPFPKNSVRDLLAGLLELNPQRRLTAEQALHHPWLRMTFRLKPNEREGRHGSGHKKSSKQYKKPNSLAMQNTENNNMNGSPAKALTMMPKTPSKQAMEDAIHRDVARRVMESNHVQHMLMLDRQRHLQFVADCCNMLNLNIPPEIIKVQPGEPYREDVGVVAASGNLASTRVDGSRNCPRARNRSQLKGDSRHTDGAVTGTLLQSAMMPAVMPPGCVDTELFLPHSEEDYYEQKSGKSEFDVRVLRRKPLLMAQLDEYFHNVVLVQCGYRTGPDPKYQAMRVRAVPMEDEMSMGSGDHRWGSSGRGGNSSSSISRGSTQQPSVVILPGAGSNAYRHGSSSSAAIAQISTFGSAVNTADAFNFAAVTAGTTGAEVLVEDVWGAGPRHQPRVRVDENGDLISAAAAHHVAATSTTVAAGRLVGNEGNRNDNNATVASASRTAQRTVMSFHGPATANAFSNNTNNNNSDSDSNPRGSAEGMGTPEVMGTAVLNTARASAIHGGRRSGGHHRSNNTNRVQQETSESASEAERNVAMRESSKCLCGLM